MRVLPSASIVLRARVRDLVTRRVAALVERMRQAAWPAPLQRWSGDGWAVIAARWPRFAELVSARIGGMLDREAESSSVAVTVQTAADPVPAAVSPDTSAGAPTPGSSAEALIAALLGDSDWQARRDAALRLGDFLTDNAIDALIEAARDPSTEVAVAAVTALGNSEQPRVIGACIEIVANLDGYFGTATRVAAIAAVARHAPETELGAVFDAVRATDAEVSLAAILALGERMPSAASEHLLPVLRDGSGFFLPLVRQAAAGVLVRSGALTSALAAELLAWEQDPQVRELLERRAGS